MRQNLLETYSKQLRVAEAYVAKNFDGRQVSDNAKLATAVCLDNTNRWITEAMNTTATVRSDLGDWKKFCLNLTNIAVPSLIANDLVIVHPMTSYSGSVAYLKYVTKTDKGQMAKGTTLNHAFGMGDVNDARTNYTSPAVVETLTAGTDNTLIWTPFAHKVFNETYDVKIQNGDKTTYAYVKDADGKIYTDAEYKTLYSASEGDKAAYKYDMEYTPANDIPTIGPKMEHIALVAEPRRIAVKYDQITAFQAKTDYGFSLDKQIAEQACGELMFEIDTEMTNLLVEGAGDAIDSLKWSKALPVGVSKFEHYNGFLEIIENARMIMYARTKKFHPNYMLIAPNVLPVLRFVNGFTPVKSPKMNGPYKVGEIDNMGVYVTPSLGEGKFVFGLNGSDMMSSAAVYAPYMAIVPTQLLGTPDGGIAQGFSTWYSKALLNKNLLVMGQITDAADISDIKFIEGDGYGD